jgi:hypothetical protein
MALTHRQQFNKRHGKDKDASNSKAEITRLSGISKSILDEVEKRGQGAHKSNPQSVRTKSGEKNAKAPMSAKMSKEQWGISRIYAFVNKIESGKKLNHDTDLRDKIKK